MIDLPLIMALENDAIESRRLADLVEREEMIRGCYGSARHRHAMVLADLAMIRYWNIVSMFPRTVH